MRFTEFTQIIDEVAMNPASLRKLAAETGALAGMEFEMIVPDVANPDPDEGQMEPDYAQDIRANNFDEVADFFRGGDGINSDMDVQSLIAKMQEDYSEWSLEQQDEDWAEQEEKVVRQIVEMKYIEELEDRALKEVEDESGEFGVGTEEFKEAYNERLEELIQEKIEEIIEDRDDEYEQAREEWMEEYEWPSEREWLSSQGMRSMAEIESGYPGMVFWPYYVAPSEGGDVDISSVAEDFQQAIGKKVKYSMSYHGAKREPNTYVVEPDSSLKPNNDDDSGLEFVSPPLPVDEMLSDLNKVKSWAEDRGCYTNESTGLHMNVSVPNFSRENCDYVKLALLLGDDYVSSEFDRLGNTYAKSAMAEIQRRVQQRPDDIPQLLQKMRQGLSHTAMKIIHSGTTGKYTSINTHDGYVEFRSPGGDWLDADLPKLENTLLRFVVALDAACDPNKFRQDYLKKLYLLLDAKTQNDPLAMFAQYSAGALPKEKLKDFIRQTQTQRQAKKQIPGQRYWFMVYQNGKGQDGAAMEVVASNENEAITKAAKEWGVTQLPGAEAEAVKPYTG